MDTPFVSGSGLSVARVLVGKIGRLTGSDSFSVVPIPPERVFVGEMRCFLFFELVLTTCALYPLIEFVACSDAGFVGRLLKVPFGD